MKIIIQKFGGTSVATDCSRKLIVNKILQAKKKGYSPVIVVSAMGRKGEHYATDTLIDLVKRENSTVNNRELDQIMCCGEMISAVVMTALLQANNFESVMLTGGQAGIVTDSNFNRARITAIHTERLFELLAKDKIPVVCGFQGVDHNGDFTTLGRGGSDTTASALGVALGAEMIEIYTDVDGIMTADPRLVNDAKILDKISYSEVCQIAYQGAKVIHPRAVEIAMQKNIPMMIKSTFSDEKGTLIGNFNDDKLNLNKIIDKVATGVTYLTDICQIKIVNINHDDSVNVFKILALEKISIDLINVSPGQLLFTIAQTSMSLAKKVLAKYEAEFITECAKVSVIGGGMREVPGVMADFVEALSKNNIEILQTVDSHTSISGLVSKEHLKRALEALHEKFNLSM
ncbi:aspartate kinase [Anaerosinus massiliensis]|uniref:aspartate kinase n=1 Tax=Massilibacillus massiliensis TaxID=1806837 RepID=UPI000A7AA90B|nr:aspartate kinase [Massilibacillus massiliensis]